MNKPINKHGGKRLNAGRKPKDPSGPVVRVVTWISAKQAKYFADNPHLNRTDEIKKALDAWISGRFSWISVEDRLPTEHSLQMSRDVLTIAGSKMSVKSYDYELGRWNGSPHITVTHWAELPSK